MIRYCTHVPYHQKILIGISGLQIKFIYIYIYTMGCKIDWNIKAPTSFDLSQLVLDLRWAFITSGRPGKYAQQKLILRALWCTKHQVCMHRFGLGALHGAMPFSLLSSHQLVADICSTMIRSTRSLNKLKLRMHTYNKLSGLSPK